jgi:putative adhesin
MIQVMTVALLSTLLTQAPAPAAQSRPPQTDQTVPTARGTRLVIDNRAGEIVVHAWEKDALRVQARHNTRVKINLRTNAGAINIDSESNGSLGSIDYDISAPSWMPIKVEGQYNYVGIDGIQGDISVETVRGDVVLKDVASAIAKTIEGEIQVDGGRGKLSLSSVNDNIKVTGARGELIAETTNGDLTLARMESSSVEVTTVNGDVTYEGTLADRGHYSFTNHNGDIELTIPETANVTFNVRTYNGEFSASLPVKGPDPSQVRKGRRAAYTLGNGSAEVELESFGGDIKLRRAGAGRTRRDQ